MKQASFDRGDVVHVSTESIETGDVQSAMVLTLAAFNSLGTVLIAPISKDGRNDRHAGFSVSLTDSGMYTQGQVLVSEVRAVDLRSLAKRKVETAPEHIIDDALARVRTLFD